MARTISAEEYQELGRTYYKKKQYDKAIEAFTNGIEAAVSPIVALFDYRAACHEKLGQFNAAVRDGREAIRADKKDVRGYLRTGSALQKLDKLDTAVGIYKYGMKNVPVDRKHFELLQQTHNQLTRKLSPPKAIDPLTILPVEIVEMVISYIPFTTIINCLRVSRGWKSYLIKRPKLWLHLDLSQASKPVSRAFIRRAIQYAESQTTHLTLHRFQHTDMLRNIATACKSLREIEIISLPIILSESLIEVAQRAQNLKKFVIRTEISPDTVAQILRHRPTLEHVEFHQIQGSLLVADWKGPFPKLHTLVLNRVVDTSYRLHFNPLLEQCPSIQSLALSNWKSASPFHPLSPLTLLSQTAITSLELKSVHFQYIPILPSTLKRLVLAPSNDFPLPVAPPPPGELPQAMSAWSWNTALYSRLPYLEMLVLRGFTDLSPDWLEVLLDLWQDTTTHEINRFHEDERTPLKQLWISGVLHNVTPLAIFGETGLLSGPRVLTPALKELSLNGLPCTDDDVEALLKHPVDVHTVDLSSSNVSGASLKMLADGMSKLRYLKADNCRRISSRDAVVYAEKRGIIVSAKMDDSFGARGGRKVRYG